MVRTQIRFTEEQMSALREIAAAEGVSVSQVVRESVNQALNGRRGPSREELWERALAAIGSCPSGLHDLAERHDHYFAEACEHQRRPRPSLPPP